MKRRLFEIRAPVSRKKKFLLTIVVALLLIIIWSSLSYTGQITPLILPTPHSVIQAFEELAMERNLVSHVLWSFLRISTGFLLAIIVALPLGILMGTFPVIKHTIHPFTGPLRYLPIAALIPLFIVWFGMGELMKILFLFVGIVVYLLPLVVEAVEDVDTVLLETAYTLKATRWQIIRQVIIPAASPLIFEAIRVMNGIGWTYIILAEIINAPYGLGRLFTIAQKRSKTHWIFAGIIVVLVIGFLSDRFIANYNAKKFSWKEKSGK
jgi:NitT/TauT family transport system permease protein